MVSKPPHCGQNYHLASDRLVIIGARRWKGEKRVEGYYSQTPILLCPLNLGALFSVRRLVLNPLSHTSQGWGHSRTSWNGWQGRDRHRGAGTDRYSENSLQQRRTWWQPTTAGGSFVFSKESLEFPRCKILRSSLFFLEEETLLVREILCSH